MSFRTKIYHPNIDEKGQVFLISFDELWKVWINFRRSVISLSQVCLPIVSAENWKPATKTDQVGTNPSHSSTQEEGIILGRRPRSRDLFQRSLPRWSRLWSPLSTALSQSTPSGPTWQVWNTVNHQWHHQHDHWSPMAFFVCLCTPTVCNAWSLIEEYTKDKKKFFKNAEEFTKKNSEKRPSD